MRKIFTVGALALVLTGCGGITWTQLVKGTALGARMGCRVLLATELAAAEEADTEPVAEEAATDD